jgi:hypothetical protein
LAEKPFATPSIAGPRSMQLRGNAEFSAASDPSAALGVVHLDIVDPEGNIVPHYSGNVLVPREGAARLLPLTVNDKAGVWRIQARDLLSGETATAELNVEP